jgi:HSP20 family molecular chaperone IbpA
MSESKDIQVKDKQEVTSPAEQTKPGPVFSPDVDIFENEKEIVLLADMPGVKADDLNIDLRDDTLTLTGEVADDADAGEEGIVVEYQTGRYVRQFSLSEVVDQEKIDAKLEDGVLRLTLPKVEKATPRKITVKTA